MQADSPPRMHIHIFFQIWNPCLNLYLLRLHSGWGVDPRYPCVKKKPSDSFVKTNMDHCKMVTGYKLVVGICPNFMKGIGCHVLLKQIAPPEFWKDLLLGAYFVKWVEHGYQQGDFGKAVNPASNIGSGHPKKSGIRGQKSSGCAVFQK